MLQNTLLFLILISASLAADYTNRSHPHSWKVRFYPKGSLFRKSDLIDKGCDLFIKECPKEYKGRSVCARHYDGKYKTFNSYCELELENCNGWRQWSMIKQDRC